MEKIFRFMSFAEFEKLINGNKLTNNKRHEGYTSSVGFCFGIGNYEDAERRYNENMSGIVTEDVCVVFDADTSKFTASSGQYADPDGAFFDTITEPEYCTEAYDLSMVRIVCYAVGANHDAFDWHDISELNFHYADAKKAILDIRDMKRKEEEERQERIKEGNRKVQAKVMDAFFRLRELNGEIDANITSEYNQFFATPAYTLTVVAHFGNVDYKFEGHGIDHSSILQSILPRFFQIVRYSSPQAKKMVGELAQKFQNTWNRGVEDAEYLQISL